MKPSLAIVPKPVKRPSCLDPKFRYTPAAATDIRKTFSRVRKQIKATILNGTPE